VTDDVIVLLAEICDMARDYVGHRDLNVAKLAAIALAIFDSPEDGPETLEVIRAIMSYGTGDA